MTQANLPPLPEGFEYRLDLRHHVTPRLLRKQPVHRWFFFPHSFSPQLLDEVLKHYPLSRKARILDPFVGAGTTVLRARQLGYTATGTDLLPLSIFVSRVKVQTYNREALIKSSQAVLDYRPVQVDTPLPKRILKTFTQSELRHIWGLRKNINALPDPLRNFFLLALLRTQQRLSRAVPNGGWFRWIEKPDQSEEVSKLFKRQVDLQIDDVASYSSPFQLSAATSIFIDDARILEKVEGTFDLVITSPPYPNRHDYSRVFHIELLMLGLEENRIRDLRYRSIRSHVEAKAPFVCPDNYQIPDKLQEVLENLPNDADPRIAPMLKGYFEDMYLTLKALHPHLSLGALSVFVVGNVRHAGVMVPVDEILVEVGQQAGYEFETAWVARLRGNSAQQMGRFGREPARETIVFLRKV